MATTTREQNIDLVRGTFEALNDRDREAFARAHAEDLVVHHNHETYEGLDTVVEHEWENFDGFPDMEYTPVEFVADDDAVACRYDIAGTHEGEYEGIPPTGETMELQGSATFHVDDGEITTVWLHYDALGVLDQLGIVEPPTG